MVPCVAQPLYGRCNWLACVLLAVGPVRSCSASKKAAAAKEIMGGYDSDEYDDFGRKRKRFRGKTATQG